MDLIFGTCFVLEPYFHTSLSLALCLLGNFHAFCRLLQCQMVSDPDQARQGVGPDLGSSYLQRLSADVTSRQRAKLIRNNGHTSQKTLSKIRSEWQTVWIQIRPDILSGLIWIQNVCKKLSADDTSRQIVVKLIINKGLTSTFNAPAQNYANKHGRSHH